MAVALIQLLEEFYVINVVNVRIIRDEARYVEGQQMKAQNKRQLQLDAEARRQWRDGLPVELRAPGQHGHACGLGCTDVAGA